MKFEPVKETPHDFQFIKSPAKIDRGISIVIYADPGKGKTTLTTTLPEGETLIINTEAGLGPTLGTNHVIFNLIQNPDDPNAYVKQIDELHRYLATQDHPFKNVSLDNVSEMEQGIILELTHQRRKEYTEVKEYGDAANKVRDIIRKYRDLTFKGINVVFNAWEAPIELKNKDGEIITKCFPKISKRVAPEFCGIVDIVGHLEVYEKTGNRWVRFGQSDQYITKSQFKGLDDGEPADLQLIFRKVKAYDYLEKQTKTKGSAQRASQSQKEDIQ